MYDDHSSPLPLCIVLPQLDAYFKYFVINSICMKFLVNDKELLIKYNKIWNRIKHLFGKEFNSKPIYPDKYIKANSESNKISINSVRFYF